MKLRDDLERMIYAAAFALRLGSLVDAGYPHAWRVADADAGRPAGSTKRIEEWEAWCADLAVDDAEQAVEAHRSGTRRRR